MNRSAALALCILVCVAVQSCFCKPACVNAGDDSCANGQLLGAGLDDDYLTGGSSPGKRSQGHHRRLHLSRLGEDDVIGAGDDDMYLTQGDNPGKRALRMLTRCINLGGDSCANGYFPGAGLDDSYLNGASSPGKRSLWNFFRASQRLSDPGLIGAGADDEYLTNGDAPGKRAHNLCVNLGDDSCSNGALPGAGLDDDYLNGGGSPGKRSMPHHRFPNYFERQLQRIRFNRPHQVFSRMQRAGCVSALGDCANGDVIGAGNDDAYLNDPSPNNPGK